jgi:hypothetical protein
VDGTRELLRAPMLAIKRFVAQFEALQSAVLVCDRELCALPLEVRPGLRPPMFLFDPAHMCH